jgi:excisionase family DNA binding protein
VTPRKLTAREEPPGYLRPPPAARYLSVSPRTLRNWTRAGVVPCIRPGGGRVVLYGRADLDRALARFREGVVL